MTAAWLEIIEPIPLDWLEDCYRRALQRHEAHTPLAVSEIFRAWREANESGEVAKSRMDATPYTAEKSWSCPEYGCYSPGMIIVDRDGNSPPKNPKGYTYVKACPIHRPNGIIKLDPTKTAPWCVTGGPWPRR